MMKISTLCFLVLALGTSTITMAQNNILLYNFKGVAQSSLLNPGIRHDNRFSISLVDMDASVASTGFSLYDLMGRGSNIDDNITNILGNINNRDFIRSSFRSNIFFTSFDVRKTQISFGGAIQSINYLTLPVNLMHLIRGNDQDRFRNREVQFGNFGFDYSTMLSYHIGFNYEVNNKLNVGARYWRHNGLFNASMRADENDLSIFFSDEEWRFRSNSTIRTSNLHNGIEQLSMLNIGNNTGNSVDFGASYQWNEKLSFSASILGIGSITYRDDLVNYTSKGEFEFEGIEVDMRSGEFRSGDFLDSLGNAFEFKKENGTSYRRSLPTEVYLAAEYQLHRQHQLHGIFRYTNWGERHFADVNLRYVWMPSRFFHAMGNISTTQGSIYGMGVGLQAYVPGFQFYILTDYMTNSISLTKMKGIMVHTGINVALYNKKRAARNTMPEATNQ